MNTRSTADIHEWVMKETGSGAASIRILPAVARIVIHGLLDGQRHPVPHLPSSYHLQREGLDDDALGDYNNIVSTDIAGTYELHTDLPAEPENTQDPGPGPSTSFTLMVPELKRFIGMLLSGYHSLPATKLY
ncbi:hypothetical protein ACJJTC_007372 [Scirpophaga incertulas]